ncbi:MAG: bifunctional UDP-N-acetylglucosamine diphosphorylase/glucosamine-1-phosphate N-acetyltransferase GlmU [Armatimonadetes bacterium]|nr:bifunctional UDP-N-acetylglucosamine diphosphorylase/glucosamine-1-phosphate N-acetyltransferase GlmU [Armatimonadota bacterium]
MGEPVALLLATDEGVRMDSGIPDPQRWVPAAQPLCGRPVGRYPVEAARRAGVARVIGVAGSGAEQVRAVLGADLEYVHQELHSGDAWAIRQAAPLLEGFVGPILVLRANAPLIDSQALQGLLARHHDTGAVATLLTVRAAGPAGEWRSERRPDGTVARIVPGESGDTSAGGAREMDAGCAVFHAPALLACLARLSAEDRNASLPHVVETLAQEGQRVEAVLHPDPLLAMAIHDRVDLARAAAVLRGRILERHMRAGVTVVDPATTYVDIEVEIEPEATVQPLTFLHGRTHIGRGAEIGPMTRIVDARIGERAQVLCSVVTESEVGEECRIGPYAQLRPGCRLGKGVKVGNFVELKNAIVEDRVAMSHLSYIGDAFVGERTNIGAGTITCNYDGKAKHPTRIGRGAFIGSHATLIAPVEIGDGAYVAAASPVHENVPPDALAIARCRQTVKEGWAKKRREGE